jgi:hypothetical protein
VQHYLSRSFLLDRRLPTAGFVTAGQEAREARASSQARQRSSPRSGQVCLFTDNRVSQRTYQRSNPSL